ncbi:MAG: DegT/DnrJ/EryC1/StrS family aminotransferase [Dehalococcoidia bacterium]
MTAETAQPLAIDGGQPVRATPWPVDHPPPAAGDPEPAAALAQTLATLLDVTADRIALFARRDPAAAAATRAAAGDRVGGELLIPALGGHAWLPVAEAAGLAPVPVEVDAETGAMAPRALAQAMIASPSARAVVAVHPFGHPAALTELQRVAGTATLALVEDATSALGASERGRHAGTVGAAGLFRLGAPGDPTAPFALVMPDAREGAPDPIDDAVARTALAWLRAEPEALALRRRLAWEFTFGVRGMRGVAGMHHGRHVRLAYGRYVARLRRIVWKRPLEKTLAALRAEGIPCAAAFTALPLHRDPAVLAALGADDPRLAADHFTVAARLPHEWIAFPLPATGTQHEVDDAVAALRKIEAAGT